VCTVQERPVERLKKILIERVSEPSRAELSRSRSKIRPLPRALPYPFSPPRSRSSSAHQKSFSASSPPCFPQLPRTPNTWQEETLSRPVELAPSTPPGHAVAGCSPVLVLLAAESASGDRPDFSCPGKP
jgi:hypothetical protein